MSLSPPRARAAAKERVAWPAPTGLTSLLQRYERMKYLIAATFAAVLGISSVSSAGEVLDIHGSGTTNPSKCIWMLMDQFEDRTKEPVRLTYRAVGSSTGQKEFLGVNNTGTNAYVPHNDFGSGDIPISNSNYAAFTATGKEMVHLPFVLGAISIFHNIPGVPDGPSGLNLTSCVLSQIFKREIKFWDDDRVLEMNPNLKKALPYDDYPITVSRRVHGSSSTSSVTKYLHTACPSEWPSSLVGKTIDWPEGSEECEGSGGMTKCLKEIDGAIGYIDAGHGHSEGLKEIELQNVHGTYLSSRRAAEKGGIGAAAAAIPDSADADFGSVDLLNKAGEFTWPIVAMSYVYVRKDLSFIETPEQQSLLVAFLKNLYDPKAIEQCSIFGFTRVPNSVRKIALKGIDMLQVDSSAPEWIVEEDTIPGDGQGTYVISQKRRSYAEYQRYSQESDLKKAMAKIAELEAKVAGESGTPANTATFASPATYTDNDAQKLTAALALGAISFSLWCIVGLAFIAKRICGV